jgi:hypothetical protein
MDQSSHSPRRASLAKPRSVFASDHQADLFPELTRPPVMDSANARDLDIGPELLGALNTALRAARDRGLSRERVIERANQCLPEAGKALTKRQLDCWTAVSREHHELPARYLPAICWATGSDEPLRVLARALGYDLVDAREAAAKRLGEAHVAISGLRREVAALTRRLGT